MPSKRAQIEIAAALTAVMLFFGAAWLRQWRDEAVASAIAEATKKSNGEQAKAIDTATRALDAKWQSERGNLVSQQKQAGTSPEQMAAAISAALLRAAPQGQTGKANPVAIPVQPQANGDLLVPKESVKPLFQAVTDLPICKGDLGQCGADLAAEKQKSELQKKTIDTLETQLKGGTKKQRFMKFLKCAGVAGAGAVIGAQAGGAKGAGIGSIAGSGVCAIAF